MNRQDPRTPGSRSQVHVILYREGGGSDSYPR